MRSNPAGLDLAAMLLSVQVACLAMLIVVPIGIAAAWWLAFGRPIRGKLLVDVVLTLPLVLPPTVVGFYLLLLLGHGTWFGRWLNDSLQIRLLFTWQGASIAAAVMAFPLFVRTAAAAFGAVDRDLIQAGRSLGAGELVLLFQVSIPLAYRGLLAGAALAFARALGEFGATMMVAGSIPGRTRTLPLALYAAVQEGKDGEAMSETLLLTAVAFVLLGAVGLYQSRLASHRGE